MSGIVPLLSFISDSISVLVIQSIELPSSVVLIAGITLLALLTAIVVLTVGYSGIRYRRRKHTNTIREELQPELLDRLYRPADPEWDSWVATLSDREQSVLESLLDKYLRELNGSDAQELAQLGEALGINDRARSQLQNGDHYQRLHALTWLSLLRDPPDFDTLETHCTQTPRERATAARVLYASDYPELSSVGVDLLLRNLSQGFSVFGIDTLYRVAESNPTPLVDRAAADYDTWRPALQQQVLQVTRHVNTVIGATDLSWIVDLLASTEERTRVEAAHALGGYGWRSSLRNRIDTEALCSDPSPKVRASGYRMLGQWGDENAVAALCSAAATENDARAQVAAAKALIQHQDRHSFTVPDGLQDAWLWTAENVAVKETATSTTAQDR